MHYWELQKWTMKKKLKKKSNLLAQQLFLLSFQDHSELTIPILDLKFVNKAKEKELKNLIILFLLPYLRILDLI